MARIYCTHDNEYNGLNRREKLISDFTTAATIIGHQNLINEICNYLSYNELFDFTEDLMCAYDIDCVDRLPTE